MAPAGRQLAAASRAPAPAVSERLLDSYYHPDQMEELYIYSMGRYFHDCYHEAPFEFIPIWTISAICGVIVLFNSIRHVVSLRRMPISPRQQHYIGIAHMPLVFGCTTLLSILAPRTMTLLHLLQAQYEAWALASFGSLLFLFLTIAAVETEEKKEQPNYGDHILNLINQAAHDGPKKHFFFFLFCFPYYRCWPAFDMKRKHLLFMYYMLEQFTLATPVLAILAMWGFIALAGREARKLYSICEVLKLLSTTFALWGLFSLYRCTHDALEGWNTTKKFVAIKLVLILNIYQG